MSYLQLLICLTLFWCHFEGLEAIARRASLSHQFRSIDLVRTAKDAGDQQAKAAYLAHVPDVGHSP